MCFTRVSASIKTDFAFSLVWRKKNMCFICVSASIKTTFAFFLVWGHNACVLHACLHQLRRLLRFPWYCVTMHAFQTLDRIELNGYCVFLGMASKYMCFLPVFASVQTAFAAFVGIASECMPFKCVTAKTAFCVFLRMALQCTRFLRVSASVKTVFTFSLV